MTQARTGTVASSSFPSLPSLALYACGVALLGLLLVLRTIPDWGAEADRFIPLYLAAFVVYLLAVGIAENRSVPLATVLVAAALYRLVLWPGDPTLSDDIYRYVHDGWVQTQGMNPFALPPAEVPGHDPRINHPEIPTIYPPGMQILFFLVATLSPTVGAMKGAMILADLALCGVLVALLQARGLPGRLVLVYAWNPLVLVEFAHGGHNDVVVLLFLFLALWAWESRRRVLAHGSLGLSVLSKVFTGPLWPFFLRLDRRGRAWLAALAFPAVILVVALPYAMGGYLFGGLGEYAARWHFNDSVFGLLRWWFGSKQAADLPLFVIVVLCYGALLGLHFRRKREPLESCAATLGLFLILMPTVHPWYVTWVVPFLVFRPRLSWLLLSALVVLSYHVRIGWTAAGVWEEALWIRWLEYGPFYAVWLGEVVWERKGSG